MTPQLSIVVCTHNQAAYLRKALASLLRQNLAEDAYEILVIDNGSVDGSKETLRYYEGANNLRYFSDPVPGLSRARNTGWQNARGKYVAYIDDDALATPDWAGNILSCFETHAPEVSIVGGIVTPIWEAEKPEWLTPELERHLSIVNWGALSMFIDDDRFYLAGTNVSYRRSALQNSGGFPAGLGREGSLLRSNEELWMQKHLRKNGGRMWYDAQIHVQHYIKAHRLHPSWFYERFYWQGISDAVLDSYLTDQCPRGRHLISQISKDVKQLRRDAVPFLKGLLHGSRDVILRCRLSQAAGRLVGDLRVAFGREDGPRK